MLTRKEINRQCDARKWIIEEKKCFSNYTLELSKSSTQIEYNIPNSNLTWKKNIDRWQEEI